MIKSINDAAVLSNGVKMPYLGLGVCLIEDGGEVVSTIKAAIKAGYRSVDTAAAYGNEEGVGQAIKECGVDRKELFITTKLWNSNYAYDVALKAFEASLERLKLEYIDLYLLHWPAKGKYKEAWRAMENIYSRGLARAIGVSNFQVHHLEDLMAGCNTPPMVNQVEFHPLLTQAELRSYCKNKGIQMEAWSPLMQGHLDVPLLEQLGRKYGKSPAQIVLRWDLQHEVVTIPKSTHEKRILENCDIFDFVLTEEEMNSVDRLNRNSRFGPDPDNFDF